MRYEDLPQYWQDKVTGYIKETFNEDRKRLGAEDFRHSIVLHLPDKSFVYFNYAFYIVDREKNEVGIFTEHCGHHVFPFCDAAIELLKSEWSNRG